MIEYEELEPMEYEYTNSQHSLFHSHCFNAPEKRYVSPTIGSFPIPESFFEKPYNKTTAIANKVAEAFLSFTINDPQESIKAEEPKEESKPEEPKQEPKQEPKHVENAVTLYSPSSSPRQPAEKRASPHISSNTSIFSSVDQKETLNTPSSSLLSSSPKLASRPIYQNTLHHTPNYNPSFIHSPHYNPSYTYYYEKPVPSDPLAQSHGTMHLLQGVFRMTVLTIIFAAISYGVYHVGVNFNHDMTDKILDHESDFLNHQRICRNKYESNRCFSDVRVPAIVEMCVEWEKCMFRPLTVKRSQAFAETFADMANGFSDKLTTKTMIMSTILGIAIIIAGTHIAMGHPNDSNNHRPVASIAPAQSQKERLEKINSRIEPLKFEPSPN